MCEYRPAFVSILTTKHKFDTVIDRIREAQRVVNVYQNALSKTKPGSAVSAQQLRSDVEEEMEEEPELPVPLEKLPVVLYIQPSQRAAFGFDVAEADDGEEEEAAAAASS